MVQPIETEVDRRGFVTVTVRCPHCGRIHAHGVGTVSEPSYGHRVSHCAERWTRSGRRLGRPDGREAGYVIAEPGREAAA